MKTKDKFINKAENLDFIEGNKKIIELGDMRAQIDDITQRFLRITYDSNEPFKEFSGHPFGMLTIDAINGNCSKFMDSIQGHSSYDMVVSLMGIYMDLMLKDYTNDAENYFRNKQVNFFQMDQYQKDIDDMATIASKILQLENIELNDLLCHCFYVAANAYYDINDRYGLMNLFYKSNSVTKFEGKFKKVIAKLSKKTQQKLYIFLDEYQRCLYFA